MKPLLGRKVVDFSHMIAGPFATFYLAQLGATVYKIEPPGDGDLMRHLRGDSTAFDAVNSGKAFEQIDIKSDAGRARALALAADADVFLDNYRPGVLERHGLGYAQVREINPKIVYCAVSGYGLADATLAQRGAYDHVIQALTGMTMLTGSPDDPPIKTGFPLVDAATGIVGALAIVSALLERDRIGEGCLLDVNMWTVALQLMYPFVCETLSTGKHIERVGNQGYSGSPAADFFRCRDGWIAIGANTSSQLAGLVSALAIPQSRLAGILDTKDSGAGSLAVANDVPALKRVLQESIAELSGADLEQKLNRVGVPAARIRQLQEFVSEFRAQGLLTPMPLGTGKSLGPGLGWRVVQRSSPTSANQTGNSHHETSRTH